MDRSPVQAVIEEKYNIDGIKNLGIQLVHRPRAPTLGNQGRRKEAERLEGEMAEMSKANLGADNPDTLTSAAKSSGAKCGAQGRRF